MTDIPAPNNLLIARPTDEANICRIESQTEVASSSAFQSIDEQYYAGHLTSTEVAVYKARYMKLHEYLKRTRDNEFELIQLAKRYMGSIEEQRQELGKADQFPDNAITEPSQLRAQILNCYNTAMEIDERVEMLQYETQLLKEERKLLNRDYSKLPSAELEAMNDDVDIFKEMERRMRDMQNDCQDLWLQIDMLKMETKRWREQLRQSTDFEQEIQTELANMEQKVNDVKAEWVVATDLPGQYSKEAEKARKYKSNAEKELQNLVQDYTDLSETLNEVELKIAAVEAADRTGREALQSVRLSTMDRKQQLEKSTKLYDSWYEMEMMNRTQKARYVQRLHIAEQEKKDLSEELAKITRERDAHLRHWRKVQTVVESLNDAVRVLQQLHDKARARYIVTPRYDGEMLARKRRLARAIEHLEQDLQDELKRTSTEVAHLSRTVGAAERRLSLMEYLRAENWELIRLTTGLNDGLSKAIHEYTAAKRRHERLLEDLNSRDENLKEFRKRLEEIGIRLNDVSAEYTKMKLERNKCVSLLQASVKLALDTRERLRIQMNEAEIIIFHTHRQDRELFREKTYYGAAMGQRDHRRNDLCRVIAVHAEHAAKREQMRRSIHHMNIVFNQTEAESLSVRKARERCAQIRNERALLLIERNQEVYILQQRLIAQDNAWRVAENTLHSLEEEHTCLNRYHTDLIRHIEVVNGQMPLHRKLTAELQGLVHQLIGSRMELAHQVEMAEDPDIPGRMRLLGGNDPSQRELWITLGKLERRMAAKEEDMAEKNLTYEAVCRLVDSLQVRANSGKYITKAKQDRPPSNTMMHYSGLDNRHRSEINQLGSIHGSVQTTSTTFVTRIEDTLTLAIEVNNVKTRLLRLRNYMKTMYAEMVVCGAERNQLKKRVKELEHMLDIYSLKMRYGHPIPAVMKKRGSGIYSLQDQTPNKNSTQREIIPMRAPYTMPIKPDQWMRATDKFHGKMKHSKPDVKSRMSNDRNKKNGQYNKSNDLPSSNRDSYIKKQHNSTQLPPLKGRRNRLVMCLRDDESTKQPFQNAIQIRAIMASQRTNTSQLNSFKVSPRWLAGQSGQFEPTDSSTTPPLSLIDSNESVTLEV